MIFEPINDNIIAIPEKAKTVTASGILLGAGTKIEQPRTAKVIAVGDKVKLVSVDDHIIFQAFAASDLKVGDDDYLAIREEFVIATIKGGSK
ncbi:MAG: co-chaperone GroES [Chlamydiae bacterium]|nr:co-chaperone GroES [Chlamydiota bacterium]